ncbi:uncharacterized protein LOC6724808 [Drosophila simulans]|uniref:GD16527 n=1 Tax=Drosophila simulans TaxID=7240 RepID=B4R7H7_DROSI|nr:uncharacterized protein LOC6724808 [Drosophila simulans]EDX16788.1 GD16527 [Drosophila simulans]KMZ07558.1 uncharacterized protein Dsimw501_GD16527 [Drosophila simulans]
MSGSDIAGIKLTSGPTSLRSRILVRNLPPCTREELSFLCYSLGTILGSLVIDNHGFIQFATESEATRAIEELDHSTFKSKVILVSNASFRSVKASCCVYAPQKKKRMVEWSDADDVVVVERNEDEDDEDEDDYESDNEKGQGDKHESCTHKRKRYTNLKNTK